MTQNHPSQVMDGFGLYEPSSNEEFDDILTLACFITGCSAAYLSIIDDGWQNIRYTKNYPANQDLLAHSICYNTVSEETFVQISNLDHHPQVKGVEKALQQNLNFYAGFPLIAADGLVLGTLCVLDTQSKTLNTDQIRSFGILAKQALNLLDLRKFKIERRQVDQSAEDSRTFFNATTSVVCILDDALRIQKINDAAELIFGVTPQECKGLNVAKFVDAEDMKRVLALATSCLKNGKKSFDVDTRVSSNNGDPKWISWKVLTKERRWFVIGRDITQERQNNKSLNQLSTIAGKINNGIVISNHKLEAVWVNHAFTKITGYTSDDVANKRLSDILAGPETSIDDIEQSREELRNKHFASVELLAYKKSGEKVWLSLHHSVVLDDEGKLDSVVSILLDITKRKESEKRLELLSLVASKTNAGVSICDENGKVTWINEALEKIFGFKSEEVIGHKLIDFIKGEETDLELLQIAREKAARYEPFNLEHKVYRKDGKELWVSVDNTSIYNEATGERAQVEIINDITQRKETELQMLASREETLKLSQAKEAFVSIMSHEIRTPLNAVIGLANILHQEEKLPTQEESINLLKFSADNLLNLINDILDFNKIEVGKMTLENKRLDVRALLQDIVNSMRFKIDGKPIKLEHHVDAAIPQLVRGDKTRLYQILVNLINNAIKFTPEGFIKVSVNQQPEKDNKVVLKFAVADTGIGIAKEKQKAIFEPFTQAESNTSRKYGGSGLGLSITKKLIELFGGNIQVNSEPDVGTEFYFTLKFNKFEGPIDMPETAPSITLNAKILVVDDNEINTLLAQRVLSKFGLTVVACNSGADALALLEDKSFDLVLMDVHMPDLNGYETTLKLREKDDVYFKELPIIALTASVLEDSIDDINRSGMTDFQLKPFKPDELASKIALHLKKSAV